STVAVSFRCLPQSVNACVPASSFVSKRSGVGNGPASAASALATSSLPQPLSESRRSEQRAQPVAAFTSSALCSSSVVAWLFDSDGAVANSTAAAAVTCGAANDVPSGLRSSSGPQSEKPWSAQSGLGDVIASGSVEKIPEPGAERSLKTGSRFE